MSFTTGAALLDAVVLAVVSREEEGATAAAKRWLPDHLR